MNKKIKTIFKMQIITIGLILGGIGFFNFAKAQQASFPPPENIESVPEANMASSLNIYDAKVLQQDGNNLKIFFKLKNQKINQPQIKYSVKIEKNGIFSDSYTYNEILSLGENESTNKEIEYKAPDYLQGEYKVWIFAENERGLPLALTGTGESVTFSGTNSFVEINQNSCFLTVEGENPEVKYHPEQGVDIEKNEKLQLNCEVVSNFENKVSLFPFYKTYFRSAVGDIINSKKGDSPIELSPGEKKTVIFSFPNNPEKPQAYGMEITLVDSNGKTISNKNYSHFVIQGKSATIQNLEIDRNFYRKGETAKVDLKWTGSADSFPDSRLEKKTGQISQSFEYYVEISMINDKKEKCGFLTEKLPREDYLGPAAMNIGIDNNCQNPSVKVVLKDEKGNILDQNTFSFGDNITQENGDRSVSINNDDGVKKIIILSIIGLTLISFIIIIFYIIKKRKKSNAIISVLILIAFGVLSFFPTHYSEAAFWYVGYDWVYTIFSGSISSSAYTQGDNIYIYMEADIFNLDVLIVQVA